MAHAILIKNALAASNIDAYNRVAVADFDLDNGNIVALLNKKDEKGMAEVWEATKPEALKDLWMVAEPEYIGLHADGRQFLNLDIDVRDFVIKAGKCFTAFKPQIGDVFTLTDPAIDGEMGDVGTFAVAEAASEKLVPASAAIEGLSLKLIKVSYVSLPEGDIGDTQRVIAYQFEVVAA